MLRIQKTANGHVVFTLSGRMTTENIAELEALLKSETNGRRIELDIKDVTLVNQEVVSFLERCEADSITLKNCPAYIREWITRQRRGGA
jgi:anti-anti-sigma regulatory factor